MSAHVADGPGGVSGDAESSESAGIFGNSVEILMCVFGTF